MVASMSHGSRSARMIRSMRYVILVCLVLAACAPELQTIKLVNQTPRPIEQVFVYPAGSVDRGPSRGALAPSASTSVRVKPGNIEVLGVSAMFKVDDHTRDKPSASKVIELRGPAEAVFYDQ